MKINIYTAQKPCNDKSYEAIAEFLYIHLEQYGDAKEYIKKAMDYALSKESAKGGLIIEAKDNNSVVVGAVVINNTGMKGYIPENILVYIAVDKEKRGMGIGKKLMNAAIDNTNGDIALHVEKDNPAKKLYEYFGFTNPYLEMRLKK